MAADSEFTPVVRRLGCLRGVSTLTGFALAVEIGDWHRFTGNTIGAYSGWCPSEHSSGASRVQGRDHQDREHPRPPAAGRGRLAPPPPLRSPARSCGPVGPGPAAARARGDLGNRRLHGRWVGFNDRSKRSVIANVAIARELAGWCWSLAILED